MNVLDPSESAIELLNEYLGTQIGQVGYSQEIPWDDGTFDQVMMSDVIEHLSHEILCATVKELHRVLTKGSKLYITGPAFEVLEENTFYCPTCDCHMHW